MTDQEKALVILEQKVIAMHNRLDNVEKNMAAEIKVIGEDVKMLLANHYTSKGRAAAFVFMGSLLGGVITASVGYFLK